MAETATLTGMSLETALRLHGFGFNLLPLGIRPEDKRFKKPCPVALPPHGEWKAFQTTRITLEDVHRYWGNGIARNAGIVCGPTSGDVLVIDTDTAEAEAAVQKNVPPTRMMTRTAKGYHRFYATPEGIDLPAFIYLDGLAIELKHVGHYVVAPGSLHYGHPIGDTPAGRYAEVETWVSIAGNLPTFPTELLISKCSVSGTRVSPPLPETVSTGSRNNLLFREASRLRRLGWSEEELFAALRVLNSTRCAADPLEDSELQKIARSAKRYDVVPDAFPLTESGDAEFFAACNADSVRFDHLRGRWLLFSEHRWVPQSTGEVHRLALDAIRARQLASVQLPEGTERRRKAMTWAIKGEDAKRQHNLISLARNMPQLADNGLHWDEDPWLLGVENGVVDLRTGTLRDGRPEDRITMVVRTLYDPTATCPLFDKTVADIFGRDSDLIAYMDRFLGYSMTGDCREEELAICWGEGGNGKGTLLNTVGWLLGDYADTLPFSSFEMEDRSSVPNDIAKIVGKRFVTASETIDERRLNEAKIKSLTGRDPITARFMRENWFTFQPVAKFWLSANVKPKTGDTSEGWWRRVEFIPFTQSFTDKPEDGQKAANQALKDQLKEELPGILARIVRGCLDWQARGLDSPAAVREATKQYRAESEPLQRFIDECCVVGDNKVAASGALFEAYTQWAKSEEGTRLGNQKFYAAMEKKFQRLPGRPVKYRGIGLVDARFEDRDAGGESPREARDGDIPF